MGASENVQRYAYMAVNKLLDHGKKVRAFGRKGGKIREVSIDQEPVLYDDIDTVTLYLNPVNQKQYYEYILSLNPRRVIFNPGTENPELQNLLQRNDIAFEEACTLVMLSLNKY